MSSEDNDFECETQNTKSGHNMYTTIINQEHKCLWPGCNKIFDSNYSLIIHIRVHTGYKPYICDLDNCGKRFNQKCNLNGHQIRIHSNEKKYVCLWNGCNKRFNTLFILNGHKSRHSEDRPFRCDTNRCEKSFKTENYLKIHKKFCLNIRQYICDYNGCKQTFVTKQFGKS